MSSREQESAALVSVDELVMRLEQILRSQQQDYEKLGQLIERTRQAIRKADINAIADLCQEENTIAQHVTELEKARLILAGKLTETLDPTASKPLSISEVAQAIDEPNRSRMLQLSDELRSTVEEVRGSSRIVRAAADALARHMGGLLQTVQSALSRARVYSDQGRIATGAQYQFCLDLKS